MTKERLQMIPFEELKRVARNAGIELAAEASREDLIEQLLDAFEEVSQERLEQNNLFISGEARKYSVTQDEELEMDGDEELSIPNRYNDTLITFMPRDPHWAFAYWDIEDGSAARIQSDPDFEQLILRIHDVELIIFNGSNSNSFFDIPIELKDKSWYIYLPNPDCAYLIELGYYSRGKYYLLSRSNTIRTPRSSIAGSPEDGGLFQLVADSESQRFFSSTALVPQRISSPGGE